MSFPPRSTSQRERIDLFPDSPGTPAIMGEKETRMITVKARFDGRVFIPEQPVDLPAETIVEILITPPTSSPCVGPPLAELAERMKQFPDDTDMPTDAAAQHDHYLYGTPKRPCS